MKFWKYIPVLLAVLVTVPACVNTVEDSNVNENPDEAVSITYLGKGFKSESTVYGDLFRIEADEAFTFDYLVMSRNSLASKYGSMAGFAYAYPKALQAALALKGRTLADYLVSGSGTYAYGILPEGSYTLIIIEIDPSGTSSGVCYTKDFEVGGYISYGVDGKLSLQKDWTAEYLGRYSDLSATGMPVLCDRISSTGTGNAFYYHVICPAGSIKNDDDLLAAFRKGAGVDDLKGGEGVLEWYKLIAPTYNYLEGLELILAKGGKDADNGYMDYILGNPSSGSFDVYTVEMLRNGHISGRYGKTTLEINGKPDIKL